MRRDLASGARQPSQNLVIQRDADEEVERKRHRQRHRQIGARDWIPATRAAWPRARRYRTRWRRGRPTTAHRPRTGRAATPRRLPALRSAAASPAQNSPIGCPGTWVRPAARSSRRSRRRRDGTSPISSRNRHSTPTNRSFTNGSTWLMPRAPVTQPMIMLPTIRNTEPFRQASRSSSRHWNVDSLPFASDIPDRAGCRR